MTTAETFAKNLRVLLGLKGVKGQDLANALELKSSTIYAWTHGECIPGAKTTDRIAAYFGVTVGTLYAEKIEV